MKIIIQCAGSKDPNAGYLLDGDGQRKEFRGQGQDRVTQPWVDYLVDYNNVSRLPSGEHNPYFKPNALNLYPAWRLYRPAAYSALCLEFGYQNVYILSAGWGLVRSDFLLPQYDVTFAQVPRAEQNKQRVAVDDWPDLNQFECEPGEETIVLCGQAYIPLLKKMIFQWFEKGPRPFIKLVSATTPIITFAQDTQPGRVIRFPRTFTNWHYSAAQQIIKAHGLPPAFV